jgi:hypothetical protein
MYTTADFKDAQKGYTEQQVALDGQYWQYQKARGLYTNTVLGSLWRAAALKLEPPGNSVPFTRGVSFSYPVLWSTFIQADSPVYRSVEDSLLPHVARALEVRGPDATIVALCSLPLTHASPMADERYVGFEVL